ncbi:hypothetical protein F2Q70_00005664 [Brassica cretica]|uniref:glucomannan 4-beta-mannosyltransferase n=1 Tax=Brassica cretica TaxID=69181 RepID=A0A8S9J319_BRACR|nr:hypothetical protein F2Q70_00005664 [Brassica cretica]
MVYKLSIGAASGLSWPSDRLVIQVLDDSTDPTVKQMVEMECQRWASKGINIRYQIRENRVGYKAGALKEGLKRSYVKHCEYVVIFDADFQPEPDFLRRSIPFLVHNPNIALVQARWRFVNSDECLLTRMQEMSLDYHFTVEQEVGSSTHAKKFPRIFKLPDRLNTSELGFAAFLFVCGCYDYVHGKNNYFIYLFLQTMSFFISGLGWIGTYVPS